MDDYLTAAGQRIHLSQATVFIHRLAEAVETGKPIVFQNSSQALNKQESTPAEVAGVLDSTIDQLIQWAESKRPR